MIRKYNKSIAIFLSVIIAVLSFLFIFVFANIPTVEAETSAMETKTIDMSFSYSHSCGGAEKDVSGFNLSGTLTINPSAKTFDVVINWSGKMSNILDNSKGGHINSLSSGLFSVGQSSELNFLKAGGISNSGTMSGSPQYNKSYNIEIKFWAIHSRIFPTCTNSVNYTFATTLRWDKRTPTLSLSGLSDGGTTKDNVVIATEDSDVIITDNGNPIPNGSTISTNGRHNVFIRNINDVENRSSTYTFTIDKTRPYLRNLSDIQSQFGISESAAQKLSSGQEGNTRVDLGASYAGVEFDFADEWTGLNISVTEADYIYDTMTGVYTEQIEKSYTVNGRFKLMKSGRYTIIVTDDLENELRLDFRLGTEIKFNTGQYTLKGDRYILAHDNETQIIGFTTQPSNLMAMEIDGVNSGLNALSLARFKEFLAAKDEMAKSARITVKSELNGVQKVYFDAYVGFDFYGADIHNLSAIDFDCGNGSYLGAVGHGIALEYGALDTELAESATIIKKIYAYDTRDNLKLKSEETVAYNGELIDENGYYVLRISDGTRTTEYTFKVLDEFRSANEYALKNEYFIAPEFNEVKFPLSFGTFNIVADENVSFYVGAYNAEKSYLFNSVGNTAFDFAFAAEYSVCVQKTQSGYLYRARNQGIQVAYNDFAQLRTKIEEVVKGYVKYKSMRLSDSQTIDYSRQIIIDSELKFNGRYANVAPITISGNVYDRVLLITKDFVFRINAGNDALSSSARIELTNIETGANYTLRDGEALAAVTELNGIYRLAESYSGSNFQVEYYVYIDNVAPTAEIATSKADGTTTTQTVTAADTIVLQVSEFTLTSVSDIIDNYCLAYISGYGFSDALPISKGELANIQISSELKHRGEYAIEIYDRSKNRFNFLLYIMDIAPEATFTKADSGDREHVILDITLPDRYCNVMALHIFRNQTESNIGELTVDSDGTMINLAVLSYVFRQGGRYKIVILDNFARTTVIELRYVKDMPYISVDGLNKARRVNKDITATLPMNCLYEVTTENRSQITCDTTTDSSAGIIVIVIRPRNDYNELIAIEDKVTIKAWYEADPDSYNDLSYVLDTIAPVLKLTKEDGSELSSALHKYPVKLSFDSDVKEIAISRGGKYYSYAKGQTIRLDGEYLAMVTDTAGNSTVIEFVLDTAVDYVITFEDGKKYTSAIERGVTVVKGFYITPNEQLGVAAKKDGYAFEFAFADKVLTTGLYELFMTDNAGNEATLKLRVQAAINNVALRSADGSLLPYNSLTRLAAHLEWTDLSYIKDVVYRTNSTMCYGYTKGDVLTEGGTYIFAFTDVVDNMLEVRFVIDNEVDITINYDKSYPLEFFDEEPNTLTTRFKISHGENGITMTVKCDGAIIECALGSWQVGNGVYEVTASDVAGNDFRSYITVIGETLPSVRTQTVSGEAVENKSIHNETVVVSWTNADYIAYVNANSERIENGERIESDGKYTIDIVDLLGRVGLLVFTVKTEIDYAIVYQGSNVIEENGLEITFTRGFKLTSSDELTIAATLNGEPTRIVVYTTYVSSGDYALRLEDKAGNIVEIRLRVVSSAFLPEIIDANGVTIANNGLINTGFTIRLSAYIAQINVNDAQYLEGDVVTKEGRNIIEVIDVVGATATLYVTIDSTVSYQIYYGKTFDKPVHILTDKFKISAEEDGVEFRISKDGEEIAYSANYYVASGLYDVVMRDGIGNEKTLTIEVDNRTPGIRVIDETGEEVERKNTNRRVSLVWSADRNIGEVKINGNTVENGAAVEAVGTYEIVIVNLLGKSATRVLTIKHVVDFEVEYRVGSFEYRENGKPWVLTAGFAIIGKSIVSTAAHKDGQAYIVELGAMNADKGEYVIELTDDAGNVATLNLRVSDYAIAAGIVVDGERFDEQVAINRNFRVADSRFVRSVTVNGSDYAQNEITEEGKYQIEYTDVLGRKAYQNVRIDKTVAIAWEYVKEKTDQNGKAIYMAKRLRLAINEPMAVVAKKDGEGFDDFVPDSIYAENALFEVSATDAVGNVLTVDILVDNTAPIITVREPDELNRVHISVSDSTDVVLAANFDGETTITSNLDLLLDRHGKYILTATDELGNSCKQIVQTDMSVEVGYNFFNGQSINYTPTFDFTEIVNYELSYDGVVVEDYKINGELTKKGGYVICFTDRNNNSLELSFDYLGRTRKLAATEFKLPSDEAVDVTTYFNLQPIELVAKNGVLNLDKSGDYEIVLEFGDKKIEIYAAVINDAPIINLGGKFKSKTELRAYGEVSLGASSEYLVYYNGELIGQTNVVDKVGKYKVVATDSVGNTKELEFEIYYRMNGWSIMLIVLAAIMTVLIIALILKRKGVIKIKKFIQRRSKK